MFPVPGGYLAEGAPAVLFVDFGDFPCDGAFPVRPEVFGELLERLHEPVWRFVEDHRPCLFREGFQQGLAPFFLGQEPFEAETVAGEAGTDDRRNAGGCSGKGLDFDPFFGAGPGEEESGVGDARCPGVANQRDVQPAQDAFLDQFAGLVFIVFMVRLKGNMDIVMLQQHGGGAGVFREDEIGFPEDPDGPQGHVLQVPDWGWNNIEPPGHHPSFLRMAMMKL